MFDVWSYNSMALRTEERCKIILSCTLEYLLDQKHRFRLDHEEMFEMGAQWISHIWQQTFRLLLLLLGLA